MDTLVSVACRGVSHLGEGLVPDADVCHVAVQGILGGEAAAVALLVLAQHQCPCSHTHTRTIAGAHSRQFLLELHTGRETEGWEDTATADEAKTERNCLTLTETLIDGRICFCAGICSLLVLLHCQ